MQITNHSERRIIKTKENFLKKRILQLICNVCRFHNITFLIPTEVENPVGTLKPS